MWKSVRSVQGGEPRDAGDTPLRRLGPLVLLLVLIAAGCLLRLYRIERESVDYEEAVCLLSIDSPDLTTFLQHLRINDSPAMPFPFILAYFWAKLAGSAPAHVRLLFVILGTAIIPLIYLTAIEVFGRNRRGRRAGVIATLCVTLSPVHIFHAQEVRHTTVLTLLALISLYGLLRATRGAGRRWWILTAAANLLLCWSHMLTVLVPILEGLYLVVFSRTARRTVASWLAVQALLLLPWGYWVATRLPQQDNSYTAFTPPALAQVVQLTFAGDAVYSARAWGHRCAQWPFLTHNTVSRLLAIRPAVDTIHVLFFLAILAAWFRYLRRGARSGPVPASTREDGDERPPVQSIVLLLMWTLFPSAALAVISYLWRPCYANRYFLYSELALYLLAGGLIASWTHGTVRRAAVAVLCAIFGYNLILVLSGPMRTDWKSAGTLIQALALPDDLIMLHTFWEPVFRCNAPALPNPVETLTDPGAICKRAGSYLNEPPASGTPAACPRQAWAIWVPESPEDTLADALKASPLTAVAIPFHGERLVRLYHIASKADAQTAKALSAQCVEQTLRVYREAVRLSPNEAQPWIDEGAMLKRLEQWDRALELYREAVERFPKEHLLTEGRGDAALSKGLLDEAAGAYRSSIQAYPDGPAAFDGLDKTLVQQGDPNRRVATWRQMLLEYPEAPWPCCHLSAALLDQEDIDGARQAIGLAADHGLEGPEIQEQMASICVAQGDLEGAFSLYDSALRTNPARKPTIEYTLILRGANWEVAGNPVRALNAYALGVRLFPESARFRMCQAVALKKTGDFDGAAKIFRASLASDPASAATYCAGLDYLLVEQDNKPARVAAWRDLVHSYPDMPWPYCYLGKALEASQDFDGAIDAYRRAIQLDPKNVQCVETLANAFRAKGDNPGAIVAIREALQQVPDTPPLRILLIRTLLAAGDIEAARAEAAAGRQSGIEIPPDLLPKLDPNAQ